MASTASIRVLKTTPYRGGTRTWSNRYHFDGGAPADSTKWTTFSDAIVNAEKACLTSATQTIVETFGYAAGSDVPVFSKTYSTAGTYNAGSNPQAPGDCAILVRFSTAARTSKNHPLYLFNYYHGVVLSSVSNPDVVIATQITAVNTYASAWITGFSDGAVTHHRAGPNGDLATGVLVSSDTRHRDFPN